MVATVVRHGPAHVLKMEEDSLVSCCNKALFLALCLFLVSVMQFNRSINEGQIIAI